MKRELQVGSIKRAAAGGALRDMLFGVAFLWPKYSHPGTRKHATWNSPIAFCRVSADWSCFLQNVNRLSAGGGHLGFIHKYCRCLRKKIPMMKVFSRLTGLVKTAFFCRSRQFWLPNFDIKNDAVDGLDVAWNLKKQMHHRFVFLDTSITAVWKVSQVEILGPDDARCVRSGTKTPRKTGRIRRQSG